MINMDSVLTKAFWEHGKLDSCPILDFHAHMHESQGMAFPSQQPEAMIETMRRCNTQLTVFCSHLALKYAECEETHNLEVARRYPDFFKAYHAVIPGKTVYSEAIRRFENNRPHYFGFKLHCDTHATPLTSAAYAPFLEYIDANGLPALLHTWGGSGNNGVDIVRDVALRYPNAIFICGHSFHGDWRHGAEIAGECPNLYYELTAVMDDYGAIELLCEKVGSDRILFGTDLPWFDTHHGIGAVLSAEINDEDRHNIFHRGGEKLLKRLSGQKQGALA